MSDCVVVRLGLRLGVIDFSSGVMELDVGVVVMGEQQLVLAIELMVFSATLLYLLLQLAIPALQLIIPLLIYVIILPHPLDLPKLHLLPSHPLLKLSLQLLYDPILLLELC